MVIMAITNAADSCDIYEMRTQVHHACDYVIDQVSVERKSIRA